MHKNTYLKEENLLTLFSQNNFIIPEIQRDYVWGQNKDVITGFLRELKKKIGESCTSCGLPLTQDKLNMGFLYTYKPDYVQVRHERFLDENIIDGQQRLTTLFLLLFYFSLKEERKNEFLSLIRFQEQVSMSFSFKVRDLTRRFLLEFIMKVNSTKEIKDINEQTWFLVDYKYDLSIQSIIKALEYIDEEFSDDIKYYHYVLINVVFWHFKTEATSQGEELYITMNARGEDLEDNEVTKAALMLANIDLIEHGQKWEEWQQFFWKNRDKNSDNQSADNGFNSFLQCIAGLEFYLENEKRKAGDGDANNNIEKDIKKLLDIEKVDRYIIVFEYLMDKKEFKSIYSNYNDWVDKAIDQIWAFFNENKTNWFADYTDKNRGTERSKMVFVWSILHYIKETEENEFKVINVFRLLRLQYVRFNNYDRSVTSIKDNINEALNNRIWMPSILSDEEKKKYKYLDELNNDNGKQKSAEQLIWQIEDHKLNLNGKDLSGVNISHLVDFEKNPAIKDLQQVYDSFNSLFPDNSTNGSNLLRSILLFKGEFWKDTSLSYYNRYDFSEWKIHIRKPGFKEIFKKYVNNNDLGKIYDEFKESFLKKKKQDISNASETLPEPNLADRFRYYAILLGPDKFWSEGESIAIHHKVEDGEMRLFANENQIIYNSKGTFHGNSGNNDLWKEAKSEFQNISPLNFLKDHVSKI